MARSSAIFLLLFILRLIQQVAQHRLTEPNPPPADIAAASGWGPLHRLQACWTLSHHWAKKKNTLKHDRTWQTQALELVSTSVLSVIGCIYVTEMYTVGLSHQIHTLVCICYQVLQWDPSSCTVWQVFWSPPPGSHQCPFDLQRFTRKHFIKGFLSSYTTAYMPAGVAFSFKVFIILVYFVGLTTGDEKKCKTCVYVLQEGSESCRINLEF